MSVEKGKLGIYTVVYNKLEELNGIKIDEKMSPEMISAVIGGISSLSYILAEGKRMRDEKPQEKI